MSNSALSSPYDELVEVGTAHVNTTHTDNQVDALAKSSATYVSALAAVVDRLVDARAQLDDTRAQLADTRAQLADMTDKYVTVRADRDGVLADFVDTHDRLADTRAQLADTRAALADARTELADMRESYETKIAAVTSSINKHDVTAAKLVDVVAKYGTIVAERNKLTRKLETFRSELTRILE